MNSNLNSAEELNSLTPRPYKNERDLQDMQSLLMDARSRTDDWHYAHVGDLLWAFFMVACHLNPEENIRLWHAGGHLVGYAILGEGPSFDWQVLPEYEWRGIETQAVAWAQTLVSELRQQDAQPWIGNIVSGSRQDNAERIAFLEQHGFRPGEYAEVNMLSPLDTPIPETVIPSGCQFCSMAEAGDISNRAGPNRKCGIPGRSGMSATRITTT